jgi:hypothetical protein
MTKQPLPKEISDSKNGLTYVLSGDYYLPMIEVPQNEHLIGKYGRMRMAYLKEHHPGKYNHLLLSGKLYDHLVEVDKCCTRMKLALVAETAKKQGITEELKARDQMTWVGRMNNIDNSVEEIILSEYVYTR